jgi:uncharacterized protein with gpF-like domain
MNRTRAEILIGKALRDGYTVALDNYVILGVVQVPEAYGMAIARALARAWRYSIKREVGKIQRDLSQIATKQDESLWEAFVAEYARLYGAQSVRDILETTRQQIIARLQDGLQRGMGVSDIAKEIREQIPSLSRTRGAIIARTETHSAAQFASIETAKRYPFPVEKVWNSARDHRTRDFGEGDGRIDQGNHRAMNGVAVALSEPFMVPNKWGGFDPMQFPGDQAAPAYQCVNCRCSLSYRRVGRTVA